MKEFTITYQYQQVYDYQCVSLERWLKNQTIQRKNMARRLNRKYPLFAIEMMREKYPDYNEEQFKEDTRIKKKGKSMRKVKSPLKRQGRWPLFEKAMLNFYATKDQKYLEEAQRLRSRMFLPFGIELRLGKMGKWYEFPSTTEFRIIKEISAIKFTSWEEADEKMNKILRYTF